MTATVQTPSFQAKFQALATLAEREHRAGRLAEAIAAYRKFLAARPDVAEMHNNLASALLDQGNVAEATAAYEQAVALNPSLFQACHALGNILKKLGKLDEAVARFEQALAVAPDLAEAHNDLGNALFAQEKIERATAHYLRALAIKPDFSEAYHNLGNVCWAQAGLDQAIAWYERALALRPDCVDTHNNLGNVLMAQGKTERALACYDKTLALRPASAETHYLRTDLKTFRAGDPDLTALEALAANPRGLPPSKMVYIHFALGRALEDVGDYARAFQHFLQGNALKRREFQHDESAYQRTFQAIADRWDADLLARFAGVGDPSPAPIFIVGMPRSGSTLVEQILASHPLVHAAGELRNLNRVVQTVAEPDRGGPVPFPSRDWVPDADDWRQLGHEYLASLPTLLDGRTRITDKAPSNYMHIGLIRLILPNARIIHTVRDPVDTCVSCFCRLFGQGQAFSYDLAELGCYYRWYGDLMDHWRSVLPADDILDVAYEGVVGNLEAEARRLIDYCGLPWDDRCLSFHKTNRAIHTSSTAQVRRPVYRSSMERWRRYEAYLEPLLVELEGCR